MTKTELIELLDEYKMGLMSKATKERMERLMINIIYRQEIPCWKT